MSAENYSKHMEAVARHLLGEPNKHFTKPGVELRWGSKGSLSVDLKKGTFFEHGSDVGGGVLDLIVREGRASDHDDAKTWMRKEGYDIGGGTPASDSNRNYGPKANGDDGPPFKPVKTWDYVDEKGQFLFQVVRLENGLTGKDGKPEKTYNQRRKPLPGDDPAKIKNGWVWSTKGIRMVPYRLPELQQDILDGSLIFINEGEKAADFLRDRDIPATTNARGAGKWTKELNEFFRGAKVAIIRDNDPQATHPDGRLKFHADGRPVFVGQDHGAGVAKNLHGIAADVRILDLPGLPPKGDVVDWWEAGGDIEKLYDLAAAAPRFEPRPFKSRFGAVTWDRLDEAGQEHEYLIEDILTRHEVAVIYGESGSGKSFEAIDMAMAVDRGVPFNGKEVRKGGVIYQAGEGGIGVKLRLRAYRQTYMEPGERVDFVLLPSRVDLFAKPGEQDIETSRGTDALIAEIKAWAETFTVPLELVVIDTLATATPGANENASTDMSVVLTNLERIRDECRCTVLMVHHKPRNGNNPRGHSSLFANVDNAIELEITQRLDVAYRADGTQLVRQIHRATIQKNKDGERGHGWDFILKQVVLGTRPNGKPLTSVVCAPPGGQGPEVTDDKRLSDQQAIAMQALINALERHGEATPDMLKLPRSIKTVVRMGHWRLEYAALSMMDDEDPKKKQERIKKALQRAGERFFGAKWIGRAEPYVWLTGRPVPGFKRDSDFDFSQLSRPQEPMSDGMAEMIDGDIQL
ncbi:AAA family ATPase [Mesorhizobium sp.]|uniref:AAA family ATPase n=1 Tax=Mesorhizobium sp. TaxID=1871066 RepID=UPI001203F190|nr:AAA family ATPase [Mesorhizobium sp.]TIL34296.1 MAG: hypothetical protein E5Y85_11185 [Mesorhizobium sp.]